jgi:hypothetical protein
MAQPVVVTTHTTTATYLAATTSYFNYASNVPAGHFVVVAVKASSGFTVNSIADAAGNNYVTGGYNQTTGPDIDLWFCRLVTSATAGQRVTITLSGGTNQVTNVIAIELAGIWDPASEALSVMALGNVNTPAVTTLPTATTTHTASLTGGANIRNAIVFSALGTAGASSQTFTFSSGWTGIVPTGPSATVQLAFQYKIETTPTSESNVISWNTSASYAYAMFSLLKDPRNFLSSLGVGG